MRFQEQRIAILGGTSGFGLATAKAAAEGAAVIVASAYLYAMANRHTTGSVVTVDGGRLLV